MGKKDLNSNITSEKYNEALIEYTENNTGKFNNISNKRDKQKNILNHFIENKLKDLNEKFYFDVKEDFKYENSFRDGKVYQDAFNDNKATPIVQNLLGYFIYKEKWNKIKNNKSVNNTNKYSESKQIEQHSTEKKSILLSIFILLFIALAFVAYNKYFSVNAEIQEHKSTTNEKQIPYKKNTNHRFIKGQVKNNFNNPIPNAIIVFDKKYKIQTDTKGIYTIKDREYIAKTIKEEEFEIYVFNKEYDTSHFIINKNLFLKNDSLFQDIDLIKKEQIIKQNGNTNIKIETLNNNAPLNIGTTNN